MLLRNKFWSEKKSVIRVFIKAIFQSIGNASKNPRLNDFFKKNPI